MPRPDIRHFSGHKYRLSVLNWGSAGDHLLRHYGYWFITTVPTTTAAATAAIIIIVVEVDDRRLDCIIGGKW